METVIKKQKIIMWITLVIAIATQVCGWYMITAFKAKGEYEFVGEFVPGSFFVIAAIATLFSIVFAMLCGKRKVPTRGVMIGTMLFSTIAAEASFLGADIGYLLIGKVVLVTPLAICCLVLGIINLIFSIKAVKAVKS